MYTTLKMLLTYLSNLASDASPENFYRDLKRSES